MFLLVNRPKLSDDLTAFDLSSKTYENFKLMLPNNFENTLQTEFKVIKIKGKPYFLASGGPGIFLAKANFEYKIIEKILLPAFFDNKKVESICYIDKSRYLVTFNYKSKTSNMAIINSDQEVLVEEVIKVSNKKSNITYPEVNVLPLDGDIYISGTYSKDENCGSSGFFLMRMRKDKLMFSQLYACNKFKHFFVFVSNEKDKNGYKKPHRKNPFLSRIMP